MRYNFILILQERPKIGRSNTAYKKVLSAERKRNQQNYYFLNLFVLIKDRLY